MDNTENLKLLIVDDDPIYRRLVFKILRPWKIEVSSAHSIEQAKQLFDINNYHICFIDGHLGDGHGFELVDWINTHLVQLPKLALITSDTFHDVEDVKSKYPIDFILHKPINRQEITQVVQAMLTDDAQTEITDKFLLQLRQDYERSIPDKLSRVQTAIAAIQKDPKLTELEEFIAQLAKISENANQFGYYRVHQIIEKQIELYQLKRVNDSEFKEWVDQLSYFYTQLSNSYQLRQTHQVSHSLFNGQQLSASNPNVVYLVCPHKDQYPNLSKALLDNGASIVWEPSPEAAIRYLNEEHFDGALLISAMEFPGSFMSGPELIESFRTHQNSEHTITMIVEASEEVVQHKAHYVIHDYLDPLFLKEFFLQILNPVVFEPWVIHDYTEIPKLDHILKSDSSLPLDIIQTDQLPSKSDKSFHHHPPQLICLKANYEHLEWLSQLDSMVSLIYTNIWVFGPTIGALPQFENLTVCWFNENEIKRPIILPLIKQSIKLNRMHSAIHTQEEHTELYTRAAFTDLFQVAFSRCRRFKLPMNLVMVDVNALHRLNDNPEHKESHEIVKQIGKFFKSQFRRNDIFCRWHGSIFAFFFEGINPRTTQFIMDKLIQTYQDWQAPFLLDLETKLSVGISHYPEYGHDFNTLIENALISLEHAQSSQVSKSVLSKELVDLNQYDQHQHKIILLDPNEDVKKMLSYGFGLRGYDVLGMNSGTETLEFLRSRSEWGLPDLIILDRELPDMDGIDVLEQIHTERLCSAPVVFLSSKSTEEQILKGLQTGAADYIVKPFSMDIFVAKCQKLLGKQ